MAMARREEPGRWRGIGFVALLLAATAPLVPAAEPAHPNVVVVLIDDMGWSDLSCCGGRGVETEAIDRLAAEGMRFTGFYVNAPICSPSRVALTTGQYPHRWRITSYLDHRDQNERRGVAQWLDPAAPTLPRALRAAGYATGHFGKWHMGGQRDVADAPPIEAYGFDESLTNFEGMGAKLLPLTLVPGATEPGRIWEQAQILGGPVTWMQRSRITCGFVDAAVSFIDRAADAGRPFYVNVWPDDVHTPLFPPLDRWADTKAGRYRAVLDSMDGQLAPLFTRLRDDPRLRENTIVLLCSDNGPEQGCGSAAPLRGGKGSLFEGGIRSPLIVWAPGLMRADAIGRTNDEAVVCSLDLVRSLHALCSVAPAAALDGEDLSATLLGGEAAGRRQPICWRRPPDRPGDGHGISGDNPDLAIRDGRWKLLVNFDGSGLELYDLEADPAESSNLAGSHPDVVARLQAAVTAWNQGLPADAGEPARREDSRPAR
jgi:uncharacterized sulfatase